MPRKLPLSREDFFAQIDTTERAYWLGFLAADAGVHGTKLALCLQGRDRPHLNLFREAIGSSHRIGGGDARRDGCVTFAIRSGRMVKDLAAHGVTPRKTGREVCPDLPTKLQSHFWRGYFDGDGCLHVGVQKNCKVPQWSVSLTSASETLIDQFREWVKSRSPGTKGSKAKRRGTECWTIVYGGNRQARRVARLLYEDATVYLGRKFLLYCRMFATQTCEE